MVPDAACGGEEEAENNNLGEKQITAAITAAIVVAVRAQAFLSFPLSLLTILIVITFPLLLIAIVGILTSAFLLVSYYTIVSKYCGTFSSPRGRPRPGPGPDVREAWRFCPSNGLDEAVIGNITVCRSERGDGLVEGTDRAVCPSEFREDESLRLLPKCSHAFHVPCIDAWLKSHSNCPLCRANFVSVNSPAPPPPPAAENSHPVDDDSQW
ncbi:unnamed protein product [Musa acuminata subsp. malaccensis]|nr:unnamed protein product [Musa acuminata subsp. malaccensis]